MPIIDTLNSYGIKAEFTSRNDITIAGAKFSGNAQYIKHKRVMHHGTILFNSDISAITQALAANNIGVASKGHKSSHSKIVNLIDVLPVQVTMESFKERLKKIIFRDGAIEWLALSNTSINEIKQLQEKKYNTWEWNYGFSPEYTVKREQRINNCGIVRAFINTECGLISSITISGDFFENNDVKELEKNLKGVKYLRNEIEQAVEKTGKASYIKGCTNEMLIDLICDKENSM